MKKVLIKIFIFHLEVIYAFLKLFPSKDRVVFISRQNKELSLDLSLMVKELKKFKKEIEVIVLCKDFKGLQESLINKIKYNFYLYKQLYYLATSKACVTDTYIPAISMVHHKKSLEILQTAHGLGPIKKFGLQSVGKKAGKDKAVSEAAKMHRNYTALLSPSKTVTKFYSEAFGYPEEKFYNYGLPRIDYIIDNEKKIKAKILKKYPEFKKKINIYYAPTFRATGEDNAQKFIDAFDLDKYNIIIKDHFVKPLDFDRDMVYTCPEFTHMEMITVCDYLITDYSSIAMEGSLLNKKTYYYAFDYDRYEAANGFNINLKKEMPGCVFENEKDLVKAIEKNKYDMKLLKNFRNKYIEKQKKPSAKLIAELILNWVKK